MRRSPHKPTHDILCQAVFALLDPGLRLGQLLFQWQQFSDQRFEGAIFFSLLIQFFFNRHALTSLGLTSFSKSPADLSSYNAGPVITAATSNGRLLVMVEPVKNSYRIPIS